VEVEDETIHCEDANVKKVVFDNVIGHRSEESEREDGIDNKGFERATEVETKGCNYLVGRNRGG
jgi:hypothetical protein